MLACRYFVLAVFLEHADTTCIGWCVRLPDAVGDVWTVDLSTLGWCGLGGAAFGRALMKMMVCFSAHSICEITRIPRVCWLPISCRWGSSIGIHFVLTWMWLCGCASTNSVSRCLGLVGFGIEGCRMHDSVAGVLACLKTILRWIWSLIAFFIWMFEYVRLRVRAQLWLSHLCSHSVRLHCKWVHWCLMIMRPWAYSWLFIVTTSWTVRVWGTSPWPLFTWVANMTHLAFFGLTDASWMFSGEGHMLWVVE